MTPRRKRKLRSFVILRLGGLFLAMIAAYTLLVVYSVIGGLEEAASYDLHLDARDFELIYRKNASAPLPSGPRLEAFLGEKDLPGRIKTYFQSNRIEHGDLKVFDLTQGNSDGKTHLLTLILPYDLHDGNRLYLIKTYINPDDISGTSKISDHAPKMLLFFGISFLFLVFFMIQYLFRKVLNSVEVLSEWAHRLNREQLEKIRPDFYFTEIDQLADIIENAVTDLSLALTREHRFLRSASHELRTPIAVIQTSMDLLDLVVPNPGNEEKDIYQRVQRSAQNMHRLTETLLWLNRKKERMPHSDLIRIDILIEELVQENQYLLTGKSVKVSLKLEPATKSYPRVAFRIALGNLIRNALQYTDQGVVNICLSQNSVIVTNTSQISQKTDENHYGFGIGLLLVRQICKRLNINYDYKKAVEGYEAVLTFTEPTKPLRLTGK